MAQAVGRANQDRGGRGVAIDNRDILESQERALDLLRVQAFSAKQALQLEQLHIGNSNERATPHEEHRSKVRSRR